MVGLTASVTLLGFFLPLVLDQITDSQLAIGAALGVEGLVAVSIPLWVGQSSDQTWNRFGRRVPYLLLGAPLVVLGLVGVAWLSSYWLLLAAIAVYFIGYYTYYTAYQALYPDTLADNQYGRAWAIQSVFQGAAAAAALLLGGSLLAAPRWVPFIAVATVFLVVAAITIPLIKERRTSHAEVKLKARSALPNFIRRLRADRNLRWFLPAHFCWEYTLAAIRTFVMLYLITGLGLNTTALLPALVIIILAYLIAAVVSGEIADKHDPRRYLSLMIIVYAAAALTLGLVTNLQILRTLLPVGVFAGAAVLMLAYPVLLRITPAERRGEYTGYYQFNRGLALIFGSALTGWLIDRFGYAFPATDGYQVLWLVVSAVCIISLFFFLQMSSRAPR